MTKFIAVDVETAVYNDQSTICQIGIVVFEEGSEPIKWETLVNPQEGFQYSGGGKVHHVDEAKTLQAPTFAELHATLTEMLEGEIVAAHSPFDRNAFTKACEKAGLPQIQCDWIDTLEVARKVWPAGPHNHKLGTLCDYFEIDLFHHDGLSDANACGEILLLALGETGNSIRSFIWTRKKSKKTNSIPLSSFKPNPEGPFYGVHMCITGECNLSKDELHEMAAKVGMKPVSGITKKCSILILGEYDGITSKQKNAEKAIKSGQLVDVLSERDFLNKIGI